METKLKDPDEKIPKNLNANLLACGRVRVELEGESGVGSEGVGVEVREALGDVRGRQSQP